MASRLEIVSPEGLRVDGRRPNEMRRLLTRHGLLRQADGSAYVELGNTKCIVAIYGPKERSHSQQRQTFGMDVEFTMASFSTGQRKQKHRNDKRLVEMANIVKNTFEPTIISNTFPKSTIEVFIQILQFDGGALHCAINATCLALIDAGVPMTDFIVASSASFCNDVAVLDLNYTEEGAELPHLTVALMPKSGSITMLNMESRLPLDNFQKVLELASQGCHRVYNELDETLRSAASATATVGNAVLLNEDDENMMQV